MRFCAFSDASIRSVRVGVVARITFIYQLLGVIHRVGWVGLEPTTNALKGRCSTIELPTRKAISLRQKKKTSSRDLRTLSDIKLPNWNIAV